MIDWLADHFDYYPGDRDDDDWVDEYNENEPETDTANETTPTTN